MLASQVFVYMGEGMARVSSVRVQSSYYYTVSQKKHVTTFSTITLTITVRLQ